MDDAISRQVAIDAVETIGHIATMPDGDKCIRRSAVKYTLSMLPSVQSERQRGKWTATYSDCGPDVWVEWKCSECGYVRKKGWEHTKDAKNPDALFCEMCGADMRGEQDEHND